MTANTDLYHYACAIYARDGVENACLWLQDQAGVDVVFLLFCCWLGDRCQVVEPLVLEALAQRARHWSNGMITPLRQARRWYRCQDLAEGDPALYQQLKDTELGAEKAIMAWLETSLPLPITGPASADDMRRESARKNIASYFKAAAIELDQQSRQKVELIVKQC